MDYKCDSISVIGLGKLGTPLLCSLVHCGKTVIGVDTNNSRVAAINTGYVDIYEPDVNWLLENHRNQYRATRDAVEAVEKTDVTFVVVPTPSDANGAFSSHFVYAALRDVATGIKRKDTWHLVVLVSTVMPGDCVKFVDFLETNTNRKVGTNFGFVYNPEFIALGTVVRNFLNPDFVLVGENDTKSGDHIELLMHDLIKNDAPIKRMSLVNAEIAKLSVNEFLNMKIAYANLIANIAEQYPTGDADAILDAVGTDKRIGSKLLVPGLPPSGVCLPRDRKAFRDLCRQHVKRDKLDIFTQLADAIDYQNETQMVDAANRIVECISGDKKIGLAGLTYKIGSDCLENSPARYIVGRITQQTNNRLFGFDPLISEFEGIEKIFHDLQELANTVDVLAILQPYDLSKVVIPKHVAIIDFWRVTKELENWGWKFGVFSTRKWS